MGTGFVNDVRQIYICIYIIYEKSTVGLASVELAQARPNYMYVVRLQS